MDLDEDAFDRQLLIAYGAAFFSCVWNPFAIPMFLATAGALSVLHRLVFMPRDIRANASSASQLVLGIAASIIVLLIGVPLFFTMLTILFVSVVGMVSG